ncbi:hypothetical protein BH10BAC2_BH10BAC2_46840 [soil metagenome]
MRTQINQPHAFSFVVLERQLLQEKLLQRKKDNHLYSRRNLLWLSLGYTLAIFVIFFI